ncbi:MAG: alkyl sulfatase dimerization domain-containing protein [Pseudomonadota bacterium]
MRDLNAIEERLLAATEATNGSVAKRLPLRDPSDFEAAQKGRIADLPPGGVMNAHGRKAWDMAQYNFLKEDCPATVNPSLWRMAQLNAIGGLFEVASGVWQARGFDYANMTIIQGDTGWILVDPLMTAETSASALQVVNDTLGARDVSAVIITHTHPDHFGGLRGVVDAVAPPPIYAPEGFMDFAASEGVLGGNHTSRRAIYQFGLALGAGPEGTVDGGIGKTVGKGNRTFVQPTEFVGETGAERIIDGVRFVFAMASGTEAPAEFTFLLPDQRVMCMAEVCTQTQHNILTPRGAQVRDALLWARCIDEAATRFADRADVLINCHNWPVWGQDNLRAFLTEQRDIYKYIHDQTLRLANLGHTPDEIAEEIAEPNWLSSKFHARGYYGTLKFNARAVYQRYYGFFDGNPVNIDPLAPAALGSKLTEALGGPDRVMELAQQAIEKDDLQWAATLLSGLVFANEGSAHAKRLLALVYRHQGFREESGIMRNIYLMGAKELEEGVTPLPAAGGRNADLAATLSAKDWFDAYALRLNPDKASDVSLVLNFNVDGQDLGVTVLRQVEFARMDAVHPKPDAEITVSLPLLERLSSGELTLKDAQAEGALINGSADALSQWLALHDTFDLWFDIVAP